MDTKYIEGDTLPDIESNKIMVIGNGTGSTIDKKIKFEFGLVERPDKITLSFLLSVALDYMTKHKVEQEGFDHISIWWTVNFLVMDEQGKIIGANKPITK